GLLASPAARAGGTGRGRRAMTAAVPGAPVLDAHEIHVRFPLARDWRGRAVRHAHALNGVSLQVRRGEAFGIVGESGCGKSTLAAVLMGLLKPSEGELRRLPRADGRPADVQIVFQDPQSSLDPRLPAWKVIIEPLVAAGRSSVDRTALRALAAGPDVVVLDEPTSALEIAVQAQILSLLRELRRAHGLTYVLISHNVSGVRHLCDRVAVMYLGQVVEQGPAAQVLESPRHPYTRELLDAVPRLDRPWPEDELAPPAELPGNAVLPQGCFFRGRCPWATTGCDRPQVLLARPDAPLHAYRCHVAGTR